MKEDETDAKDAGTLLSEKSKKMQDDLCDICQAIIEDKRWRPFKDLEVKVVEKGPPLSAYIALKDRKIHIGVNDEFYEIVDNMIRDEKLSISRESAVDSIMYHLLVHEYNHHYYCPNSIQSFEEIMDGIKRFVEKKEFKESKIKEYCFEIHNMFSDTVINAIASHEDDPNLQSERYRIGQSLSNLLILYSINGGRRIFKRKQDKAMLLFSRSNMYLCDTDPAMYDRMSKYLPRFGEKDTEIKRIVSTFVEEEGLVNRVMDQSLIQHDSEDIRRRMCEYESWGKKAFDYAEIIYPYLKKRHDWLNNSFTGKSANSQSDGEGSSGYGSGQSQEKDADKGGNGSGQGQGKDPFKDSKSSGNGSAGDKTDEKGDSPGSGSEQGSDEQGQGSKGQGSKGQGTPMPQMPELDFSDDDGSTDDGSDGKGKGKDEGKGSSGSGGGKGIGIGSGRRYRGNFNYEELDALFKEAAGQIMLASDDPKGTQNYEHWTVRNQTDIFDSKRVDWPSTCIIKGNGRRQIIFGEKSFPLEIDASVPQSIGGVPDLCFVFDSSGSMTWNPYGHQGEYYVAVLTFYSILNGLEKCGVAPMLSYNGINFSNSTFASGWCRYSELKRFKKTMFSHQNGGTTIDTFSLRDVRNNRRDHYVMFLLSDLQISNYSALEEELIATHENRSADIVVFKLGGKSVETERLETAGISLLYPSREYDFLYQTLDLTKQIFSGAGF